MKRNEENETDKFEREIRIRTDIERFHKTIERLKIEKGKTRVARERAELQMEIESYEYLLNDWNTMLNEFLNTDMKNYGNKTENTNKLIWNSSPAHFGFIVNLLINKGYFDNLPLSNFEVNYSEIAVMFNSIIDFDTTEQVLKKSFNPNNEKMSITTKSKFTIPECKDIRPKNRKPSKTPTNNKKEK